MAEYKKRVESDRPQVNLVVIGEWVELFILGVWSLAVCGRYRSC